MNSYAPGSLVEVDVQFYDKDTGMPVAPRSVIATVLDPNNVSTTPTVTKRDNPFIGGVKNFQPGPLYHIDVSAAVPDGTYYYRFTGSDPYQAAIEGAFKTDSSQFLP